MRFLTNRQPYTKELDRLLGLDEVVGHGMVLGELLLGGARDVSSDEVSVGSLRTFSPLRSCIVTRFGQPTFVSMPWHPS
ncbi:MAG TPA: hypothetical protein VF550_04820 [Polyangia bacterium]